MSFKKFNDLKEFKTWLSSQKVSRKVTKLQVHHTELPNYSTWEKTDKKVYASNPEIGRTQSFDAYGKSTWGKDANDGHGHYIAQHFNIFPNGKITTGRDLESTPIGIKGQNTGAICIEIYGDFDKNSDVMTKEQRKSVIGLYALLCEKFKITPSSKSIIYHGWHTASGTLLGKYIAGKSAKTCPGTAFFGGNSIEAMEKNFLPLIKSFDTKELMMAEDIKPKEETITIVRNIYGKPINLRATADWDAKACDTMNTDEVLTYVRTVTAKNGSTKMYLTKAGTYVTASDKYTKLDTIKKR